ncbi:phosphoenolpyruvate synthase [Candidatus Uhrbacteria bacterium]|nr:phosphoenolpyruvate synthase [Candidatus Uhrbacteria bacterium]
MPKIIKKPVKKAKRSIRPTKPSKAVLTLDFSQVDMRHVEQVGGKNASLGEMFRNLTKKGIPVPDGFAVTAEAYWRFLDFNGFREKIDGIMGGLDVKDIDDLSDRGHRVRETIRSGEFPPELQKAVEEAYSRLSRRAGNGKPIGVAVRSSATAEDLPGASFAGQQETYLNIKGKFALTEAVRRCFASLFTNRAIVYRAEKGFDHMKVALSVGVQKMVRSDLASAGVMFTIDTESGFRDAVLVNAAWGLGESVVQGVVNPDQYYIHKPTLKKGFRPIVGKKSGQKETKIVYSEEIYSPVRTVPVPIDDRNRFCLTDDEVLKLAGWAVRIEDWYSRRAGHRQPMDIEWAKDGKTGGLFIVQARPETVQSEKNADFMEEYVLKAKGSVIVKGLSVGSKIGSGKVRVVRHLEEMNRFQDGDVLVAEMTDPDWVPIMKRAAAIVTNSGGRTCHAAIVSRELGTPAVVGTMDGTAKLKDGMEVTVSCAEGEEGHVYKGKLPFEVRRTVLKGFKRPKTAIMLNIGEPEMAFEQSFLPVSGVGLARTEFIFSNYIRIHPLALMDFNKLKDEEIKSKIAGMTVGYPDKSRYFVDRLAEGVGRIAAAFYPNDVIVRMSDFKTNEYAGLIGGAAYEPTEANPMIGWRGASRYYDERFSRAFKLECEAILKVRGEMGLKNVIVMIPFCRTPEEGKRVLATMAAVGLKRHRDGLQVYVMVEIPSNIILAEEFAETFDGFSIGSNDLTQLTLGVDRDSEQVAHLYDERNPAVLASLRSVIRSAKKTRTKIGICGQAPSDYPEFAEFLVREGIDSISLNPDTAIKTSLAIARQEAKQAPKPRAISPNRTAAIPKPFPKGGLRGKG